MSFINNSFLSQNSHKDTNYFLCGFVFCGMKKKRLYRHNLTSLVNSFSQAVSGYVY